ncbi:MAG: hypothetical protein ABI539_14400 [Acidobacteriota bacterium]
MTTPGTSRFITASLILMAVLAGAASLACSTIRSAMGPGDCGYSAFAARTDESGRVELGFSQITAETVDGHTDCGFQYIRTKVDRAEIDGTVLPERAETDQFKRNTYFYATPAGFDPQKTAITIQTGNKRYSSELSKVQRSDKGFWVNLKLE